MIDKAKIKVRFAPSPTGLLHIGGARTALFNWLFAKSKGGNFILRIEDTDRERSEPAFEEAIKDGLIWLGIDWDEFYRQSDRSNIHRDYLTKLFNEGWIYYCFCTKEELELERQARLAQGITPKYSGRCRSLNKDEVRRRIGNGESYILRFKMPEAKISFKDLIRGNIVFDGSLIGDMVVARDLDQPLYNFAVVVDDALTEITHIIRGEEHISNTPRQIFLMKALSFKIPQFAHLPLILNPDRSKMSKRFADTALQDYIAAGYLKEAMLNFLSFLGWHPKEDKEIMSFDEIIKEFDLKRIQKGGAIFNVEKLDSLNGYYLRHLEVEDLIKRSRDFLPANWQLTPVIMNAVKSRIEKLSEIKDLVDFYFELPKYEVSLLKWEGTGIVDTKLNLRSGLELIEKIKEKNFKQKILEEELIGQIPKEERGNILWPLRVALSGRRASPSPFEIMEALGKNETKRRIEIAISLCENHLMK